MRTEIRAANSPLGYSFHRFLLYGVAGAGNNSTLTSLDSAYGVRYYKPSDNSNLLFIFFLQPLEIGVPVVITETLTETAVQAVT